MSHVMLVGFGKREAHALQKIFQSVSVPCEPLPTMDNALEKIAGNPPSLVMVENPERVEPVLALKDVLGRVSPTTPFLVTLPAEDSTLALRFMRAGAFDCLVPPYDRFGVLSAAKRAAMRNGRTLFVQKVARRKSKAPAILLLLAVLTFGGAGSKRVLEGPPPEILSLGSVNLSGLQWEGRSLWVSDWFESTVTRYEVKKGFVRRARDLVTQSIYKMADAQPILIANRPDSMVSVGSDLKFRIHQRAVGLPTLQSAVAPGPNPTGLAWDGLNVWSTDGQTGLLYRHADDLRVLETVKAIIPRPLGLSFSNKSLWVIGGEKKLQVARLDHEGNGYVWRGPYDVSMLLPEGISPSGFAVGFDRIWVVSGGDPKMVGRSLKEVTRGITAWKKAAPPKADKKEEKKEKKDEKKKDKKKNAD